MSTPAPPRRVAVIGASTDRRKFGNKAVRAFLRQGYDVVPINPHEAQVEGLQAYRSVLDVPGPIDMATLYVPPETGLAVIERDRPQGHPRGVAEPRRREPGAGGARRSALGLSPIEACSIVGIGETP